MPSLTNVLSSLPIEDIEAAIGDQSNLGKEAEVVKDIIAITLPGLDGMLVSLLITFFVAWVYRSGGGTIRPDPNPEVDAQTTTNHPRTR